jgi:DNA-binding transcriptional MerR regulator
MTQWYVKELSKLTQVSVQTLHHYDRIGLLEPSVRLANGYRLYSEKDLLKLQQIIALKFFGFELSQIKTLLSTDVDMIDHFSVQSQFLEEKAKTLFEASQALKNIISECSRDKSIPWETIIKLIEVYRMTQQLEKTWAGKVLSQEELKQYASFEQDLKTKFTAHEQKMFEQSWDDLVNEVNANLKKDPTSELGITLGKRCMDWVNSLYGIEYAALRTAIWEKGFQGGHIGAEHNLSPESIIWLDKAMDAYYRNRIYNVLNQVETHPHEIVLKQWEELLTDMYGENQTPMNALFNEAMNDDKISQAAKNWLKKYIREYQHAK